MLLAYKLFCILNYPLWKLILTFRRYRGKEHNGRYIEKLGQGYLSRPNGEVIWVHALGLGETLSLTFFLQRLSDFNKDKTILFTSSTLQSYMAFSKIKLNSNIIHQFAPVDNTAAIKRFLNHWKPSISLISELDLWPNRVIETSKFGIPLILYNSRMNRRKRDSRKAIFFILKKTLSLFDEVFLQDRESKKHFKFFGVPSHKITVTGPFKAAGSLMAEDRTLLKYLKTWAKDKFVWIAASIHEDEEIEILDAFRLTKRIIPNLVLIIVPRFVELSHITEKRCKAVTRSVFTRNSEQAYPNLDTDILLISTVGELGTLYNLSDIAFVGNSLNLKRIKTGKNPFEAIQRNCIVIHGPKMTEPFYSKLAEMGITDIVENKDDIKKALINYYSVEKRKVKIKNGLKFISQNKSIVEDFVVRISSTKKGTRNL